MTIFVGFYNGLDNISPFHSQAFGNVEKAMVYVKASLEWFKHNSYGFIVYTDESVKEGRHYVQKRLMTWHRDGTDCSGELVNNKIGWRIYIDENGNVAEDRFPLKGDI